MTHIWRWSTQIWRLERFGLGQSHDFHWVSMFDRMNVHLLATWCLPGCPSSHVSRFVIGKDGLYEWNSYWIYDIYWKNTDYSNCSGYFPSSMGETWWSWPIQLCLELMWECYQQSEVGWYCWRRFMISTYFHKVWNDPAYTWNHQFHIHKQLAPGLFQGTLYDFPWPQNHRPGVRLSFRMLLWLQIGRNHCVFLRKMLHRTDKISEGGLMAPVGILDPSWRAGNQVVKGSCLQSLIIFLWQCSQYKVYQCPISGTNPAGWFLSWRWLQPAVRMSASTSRTSSRSLPSTSTLWTWRTSYDITAPMTAFRRCLLGRLQYATTATIHHSWSTGHGLEVEKSSCHWHFCPCHSPHYPRLHIVRAVLHPLKNLT